MKKGDVPGDGGGDGYDCALGRPVSSLTSGE